MYARAKHADNDPMVFYAHSGSSSDKGDWQSLPEHLSAVARLAAENARPFGLEKAAAIAGLFHDLGKYDPAFQRRLEGVDLRVDHSTAGAAVLIELATDAARRGLASREDALMAQMIGYAILGHHAGLPDKRNEFGHCFERRVSEFTDRLDPAWKTELDYDLAGLLPASTFQSVARSRDSVGFDLSVMTRFLFSALVDADFKNTEQHYAALEKREVDRRWPALQDLLPEFRSRFDAHMAGKPHDGDVNRLRGDILAHVRAKASLPPGLFTLTVPTGGGKTLASLGFALDHARLHGHRRIVYGIPFTSIIDQVAAIFRDVLGEEHILEHHSAIEEEEEARSRERRERPTSRDRLKLAMEDWAAPVVVTTNVQLFESLFAARTSRARKLHNIARSIIILDEAQTIPRHLLKPCVRMLDSLARLFGCTIVLCTATQPALSKLRPDGRAGFPDGLDLEGRELAPDPEELARRLRRTRIERVGEMDNPALIEAIASQPQALVIVNSRKHALELYKEAKEAGLDGLLHLTTRQCAAHRRMILADVRRRLDPKVNEPCRVIATSLIEAGVDVDFPKVWRAVAGLDSIVQAAGRANREGKRPWEKSIVTVFTPSAEYKPPREIVGLIGDMGRIAGDHTDLLSLAAIEDYFGEVYWRVGPGLDAKSILQDFTVNNSVGTDFAFRAVGDKFRMIESKMESVIIPFDERARKVVNELHIEQISSGKIARELQNYIVQVPTRARELLVNNGHVAFAREDLRGNQFAVLQKESLYDSEIGLLWETPEYLAVEDTFV